MECCGIPFSCGDEINWLVRKDNFLNSTIIDIGKIDYLYDAHSSEWEELLVLKGTVEKIKVLYEKYATSKDNSKILVPIDGKMVEIVMAKGFDKELDNMQPSGYIVSMGNYTIRAAKQNEVTFQ